LSTLLRIENLSYDIRSQTILDQVSFTISEGETLGILGPNGSGKTTLMRILVGLLQPSGGSVRLRGQILTDSHLALRRELGIVFQEPSLDAKLTVRENLLLGGALYGMAKTQAVARLNVLLELIDLHAREDDLVGILSGGLKRRVELARALMHEPSILFLDEPSVGLDPVAQESFWQHLDSVRRLKPITLIVNTHQTFEAEKCEQLLILDNGRVVAHDVPAKLLQHVNAEVVVTDSKTPSEFAFKMHNELNVLTYQMGNRVMIECTNARALLDKIYTIVDKDSIRSVTVRKPSLADVFFKLTGHSLGQV
jgi:ABC-2 type transport system ATP-binding protein